MPLVADRPLFSFAGSIERVEHNRPAGTKSRPPAREAPAAVPVGRPAPPVVQRARASSPTAPVLTGFVDAGAVAVAGGLAHRAPDGSVVFDPPSPTTTGVGPHSASGAAPSRPAASRAGRPGPTVQRVADDAAPAGTESPISAVAEPRTEAFAPPAGPGPTGPTPGVPTQETPAAPAAPTPATPAPTTPAATASPAAMSDRDVDRLARRLYPRLRDHLRGELRLDRERLGRASDLGLRS